jgi:hypothetical protein
MFVAFGIQAQAADEGKAFIERFYRGGFDSDTNPFDDAYVKTYLTPKALQYLKDQYAFDDDTGEQMATWVLYKEDGVDVGKLKDVAVEPVKGNTYRVTCRHCFNADFYVYTIQLTLMKVGATWKIDGIKTGEGKIVNGNPGIPAGSKWQAGGFDYTVKVNTDNSFSFLATAEGEDLGFRLTPVDGKKDEFKVGDETDYYAVNPFSTATRAKYVEHGGAKVLCLYSAKDLLQEVLDGNVRAEAEEMSKQLWSTQLQGYYTDRFGDILQLSAGIIYEKGVARAEYEHITFNGTVTGVIKITGATHLDGVWEAVMTLDGLTLYPVKEDEYGLYRRTDGDKELLEWARKDFPRFNFTSAMLLNDGQFRRMKKSTLRIMRNEILARQGYVFKSKDLQDYFKQFSWYHPLQGSDYQQPSWLEMLNLQLIQGEEAKADEDRYVTEE